MRETIRFLMDGEVRELSGVDPTLTVLNLLRTDLRRTGTKEGCAEGDCGACTVALGELIEGKVRWRAVNACILFAPMLDGRAIATVESLGRAGTPHPVQTAMVEHHGSQCGFCTPGFVMSLWTLYQSPAEACPPIDDALAGNLCRCTGYVPIVKAAQAMRELEPVVEPDVSLQLRALAKDEPLSLEFEDTLHGATKRWFAPKTLDQLAELTSAWPEAVVLAGATDVGLWVTKQHRTLPTVISLNDVTELRAFGDTPEGLRIGAGVRYSDAIDLLAGRWPDLGEMMRRLGSVQVRNSGTIGGNIANGSPIGDMPPPLIALGATVTLRRGSERRTLPLEDYFLAYGKQDRKPGEFVECLTVPAPDPAVSLHVYKLTKRFDQDISAVCGAFAVKVADGVVESARVAFGGMAATPKRATATEAALTGRPWTESTVEAAMMAMDQDFAPITDMRASAAYRQASARNLLMKAYAESTAGRVRVLEEAPAHG